MNLSHAKSQRRKGTKKRKGNFGISYSDSATPELITHTQCPMPNAQCPMPHAQCPMPLYKTDCRLRRL
ncbi:hypothetical protein H6G98_02275 [Nostoc sp. FACHB-857]|nr:hypothetical protein [Nostoc sp. FACHB-857]